MVRFALAAALALLVPAAASASSPDAWEAFHADVKAKCLAAAQATGMKSPEVLVHPLGTETYGLAVLREGADKRIACMASRPRRSS